MVLYNLVLVGLVCKFDQGIEIFDLINVEYTDLVMKYFQFAIADQKMFSVSGVKLPKINLHSLSIALYIHSLCLRYFQSKLNDWYGLYNPTGEINIGGI